MELQDILRYCQYIIDDTADMDLESYLSNRLVRFAMERSLIVIGESATHLRIHSPEIFEKFDSLNLAIGVSNRLAHDYDDLISNESIWITAKESVPQLIKDIETTR